VGVTYSPHKNSIILKRVEAPTEKKKFNRAREVYSITQKVSLMQTLEGRRRKFSGPQVAHCCCKHTGNSRLRSPVVTRTNPTAPKPREESAIRNDEPFEMPMEPEEHRLVFKNTACVMARLRDHVCGMVVYNNSVFYLCVQHRFHYNVFVTEESTTSLVQFQACELTRRGRRKSCLRQKGFRLSPSANLERVRHPHAMVL
jgi:hypothetical protein